MANPTQKLWSLRNWYPKTSFFYGWLILGMTLLAGFLATGSSQLVFGAMQIFILDEMGWDRSVLSGAITLATWISGFCSPIVGRLADKCGARWLMPIGAIVVGVSFFAISGIEAVWHFYIAYFFARVVAGGSLTGVVGSTTVVNWFHIRRNTALGIFSMAHPVGGALNIILLQFLSLRFGWRAAYQVFGMITIVCSPIFFTIIRRRPEHIGLLPDGKVSSKPEGAQTVGESIQDGTELLEGKNPNDWELRQAFRTPSLWLVAAALSIGTLTLGSINFHLVPYLSLVGVSQTDAIAALSLSSLLGGLGNVGWGALADRFGPRGCAVLAFIFSAVMVFYLLNVSGSLSAYIFALFWGFGTRGQQALSQMIIAKYYGRSSFGAIAGAIAPFPMIALGSGPTLAAFFYDWTGTYRGLYSFFVAAELLAAGFIFLARTPVKSKNLNG
jgi:MFS family permease